MRYLLIFLAFTIFGCKKEKNVNEDHPPDVPPIEVDTLAIPFLEMTAEQMLRVFAHDSMEGRAPGSTGFEKSAKLVESFFDTIGLIPFENATYRDSFILEGIYI